MTLLTASETSSLFSVLDALFIGQFLKWNSGPIDFHRHYIVIGVGASIGIGTLIVLEVSGVT